MCKTARYLMKEQKCAKMLAEKTSRMAKSSPYVKKNRRNEPNVFENN